MTLACFCSSPATAMASDIRPTLLTQPSVQTDVLRILGTPGSHYDVIQEGPFATVARTWTTIKDGVPQWVVVKSSSTLRKFTREPHDIVKELRLLSCMMHPNIVYVMGSFRDEETHMLSIYMPYVSLSLSTLLHSPHFSPHVFPPASPTSTEPADEEAQHEASARFTTIAKSVILQTLSAIAFLHDPIRAIAHRDLKPENILLTKDGCVKIIDFGVAYKDREPDIEKHDDLWQESRGKLYFEVSTRCYRAPELLFGCRTYDPLALDLWSLGATFSEFFTTLRLRGDEEDDGDDDDDTEPSTPASDSQTPIPLKPFVVPRYLRIGYPGAQWMRDTLFNGDRGEIGLAWSIFKIFGTPTRENWPEFEHFPSASSVVFNIVPAVPLRPLLPNLPPSTMVNTKRLDLTRDWGVANGGNTHGAPAAANGAAEKEGGKPRPLLLDLLKRFLVYPSEHRVRAEDALRHPWFTDALEGATGSAHAGGVVLLPHGYALERGTHALKQAVVTEWKGKTLGDWIDEVILKSD
ncbi:hypothetical protein D9619_002503 [Psilocybe cf. subviscida]|uniref:cyclin-dependent kinase n=1 Tax=Psilocybe cf. subviscida TaxID=2480587 RepID=A0A8H5AWI3_9AGAR|nr:hypothetical protein D9619_002503 [Psilocybe cf. subviscida]